MLAKLKIPCPICPLNLVADSIVDMRKTVHDHLGMHADNGEYI